MLMELQQKQLDALSDWLTMMESKISHYGDIGSDLDTIKQQVAQHKVIQNSHEV